MERLTERTADGILVKENHVENGLRTFYQCFGEKPNDNYSNCEEGYCAMEELAAYEDAEEQGLLLRLPCKEAYSKIGYEMYIICDRDIKKSEHLGLFVYPNGKMIIMGDKNMNYADIEVDEIGKTVFFTREEAESKLSEMEGAE
jgi:hypothetical protein